MDRCLLCLHELPIFQELSKSEFSSICLNTTKKSLKKGSVLFRQGEYISNIYLIKTGKLKLVQTKEDGRELILSIIGPGEVLGETALFQKQELLYSAVALENINFCCFTPKQFENLIKQNPTFALKIINYLASKLHSVLQQVGESSGVSVREKLLRLLFRLADEYGQKTTEGTIIEFKITQQEMANMIGASRVMVAKALKELKESGIVGNRRSYYTLKTDPCVQINFTNTFSEIE